MTMSKYFPIEAIHIAAAAVLLGLFAPGFALAALSVTFQDTPLFLDADVKPGDAITRTVQVTNTGTEAEAVVFRLENTFSDGLADVMELGVVSGSEVYIDTTFITLFGNTAVSLGSLPAGATRTYSFTSALDPLVGNAYQLTKMGFDLLIGFDGGTLVPDTPPSSGGGGGGGGSTFSLFNEAVLVVDNSTANLTWETNRSATSYAVCGNDANGPFILDPADALFGYEFATIENTSKTRSHSAEFADLAAGIYSCRVASREDVDDEFTVSGELQFTILPPGQIAGVADSLPLIAGNVFQPVARVAGASSDGKGMHLSYAEYRAELDRLEAAKDERAQAKEDAANAELDAEEMLSDAAGGVFDDVVTGTAQTSWWFWLVGLVVLGLLWRMWRAYRG